MFIIERRCVTNVRPHWVVVESIAADDANRAGFALRDYVRDAAPNMQYRMTFSDDGTPMGDR